MMHIENDYHYRHPQRMLAECQDNVAWHLQNPNPDWDHARLANEYRLILYQIEQCRFQLHAYEDFNEGRTNTLHDPTGAELRALEKRMWANAGRALEKRLDEHGVGRAEATKGGTFGGLEEKAYIE